MQIPASWVAVSWPVANYDNPIRRGPANVITTSVLLPLTVIVLGLRGYTRLRISKNFGIDDWLILASLFPAIAYSILVLISDGHYGWDIHIWDFWFPNASLYLKFSLALQLLFTTSATLTKLSMLVLTRRLVIDVPLRSQKVIAVVMGLVATQGVLFFLMFLFQCRNVSDYWTLSFRPQSCVSQEKLVLTAGITNTALDLIVVLIPLPVVWGLRVPFQQQLIVIMLFGAGILGTLAGAAKTYYQAQAIGASDMTWALYPVWLSGTVELYVGILCASIPATKDLFPHLFAPSPTSHPIPRFTTPSPFRSIEPGDVEDMYRPNAVSHDLHSIQEEPALYLESLEKRMSSSSHASSISSFNVAPRDRVASLSTFNCGSEEEYARELEMMEESRVTVEWSSRVLRGYGRGHRAQNSLDHQLASFDFEMRSVRSEETTTGQTLGSSSLFSAIRKVPSPSVRS